MDKKGMQIYIWIFGIYAIISAVAIIFLLLKSQESIFLASHNGQLLSEELDSLEIGYLSVKRLDVIEESGELGLSLSNSTTTPLPSWNGEQYHGATNRNAPNIVFFDGKGDEVGGISFANHEDEGNFKAIRHLAFDGYKQDEVMTFSHFVDKDGKAKSGLYIYQRPNVHMGDALKEIGVLPVDNPEVLNQKMKTFRTENPERFEQLWSYPQRLSVQTNLIKTSEISLNDGDGKPRLVLSVTESGEASINFLDPEGKILKTINSGF